MHDGQIVFRHDGKQATSQFEMKMVEEIIREVCTMYNRRIRLYEPIVNSLMDRVTHEAFSPSGLHKLVPVKDSLQHFGKCGVPLDARFYTSSTMFNLIKALTLTNIDDAFQ